MICTSILRDGKSWRRAEYCVKKGEFIPCEESNIMQNIDVKKSV